MPEKQEALDHIFRNETGHLPNTPENKKLLLDLVNDTKNLKGKDQWGNTCYEKVLSDGKQIWAEVWKGKIKNGGINEAGSTRVFNNKTGLKSLFKTTQGGVTK